MQEEPSQLWQGIAFCVGLCLLIWLTSGSIFSNDVKINNSKTGQPATVEEIQSLGNVQEAILIKK